ncbi:MAG TPA: ABC transporter permease [Ktedonobacterales bacterium]
MTAPTAPIKQREDVRSSPWAERLRHVGRALALPAGSVVLAFLIGTVLIAASGGDPLMSYEAMACGGFGLFCFGGETSALQISNTIEFVTPLLLAGLAVAVAFRAGLFNIGVQGQLILGAIFATVVGMRLASLPAIVLIPLVLLAGMLGGALWAGIAGTLKALTGAHEVVTTIMLNYIAYNLLSFLLIHGPLQAPNNTEISLPVGQNAQLPTLVPQEATFFDQPGGAYHASIGIFIALIAAGVYAFLMRRSALGYEIRTVGQSQRAAKYAGISVKRTLIVTMLISGAFAGLTGALLISGGTLHYLYTDLQYDTTGFDGIAVALLGQTIALGVVLSAILFGALHAGGLVMQSDVQVSSHIIEILQAIILFSLAANFLRTLKIRIPSPGRPLAKSESMEPAEAAIQAEVSAAGSDVEGTA